MLDAELARVIKFTEASVRLQIGDRTVTYAQPARVDARAGDFVLVSGEIARAHDGGYYLRKAEIVVEPRTGLETMRVVDGH